jgi:DNA polymerase (family X)
MKNEDVANLLDQFADLLDIKGESGFRVSAYRRGADTVKRLDEPVRQLLDENRLTDVKGIGKGLAGNIGDILEMGRFPDLELLQDEVPATLLTIIAIPGIGPKTVGRFYRELGITNIEELEQAVDEGRLTELKGIGNKQVSRITEGIAFLRQRTGRVSIGTALPAARELSRAIGELLGARAEIVGSVRRYSETVGNIDVIVETGDAAAVARALSDQFDAESIEMEEGKWVTANLPLSGSVRVLLSSESTWGSDLIRFTGSVGHLEDLDRLDEVVETTEDAAYAGLDLPWIAPELREGRGEIQASRDGALPELVELQNIRGDLHLHSTWSDGRATINELAERAVELGYEYLAIADHSHGLAVANGLNAERLRQQWAEIAEVQSTFPSLKLLRSNEVEVRRDGALDHDDDVLEELDIVVASLHSGRNMPIDELTERLLGAINNPHVDIIAHPTGRIVEQRPGADYHWEKVFEAAVRTGTVLEINANPARLDLPEQLAKRAVEAGVNIAVDSDAHNLRGLDVMEFGIGIARRAWISRESVVNTWSLNQLQEWLGR